MTRPGEPRILWPKLNWDKVLWFLVGVVAATFVSALTFEALGGVHHVRTMVADAGSWAPVLFIVLKIASNVIAPLSGTPLLVTGGMLFGVWDGLAYILIGDAVGGSLNFWIARLLGRPGIRRFVGRGATRQVDQAVSYVGGWKALLVASVVLSPVYDFVSYAAGLSNLPFRHYFWVTLVGSVPTAFVYMFVGDRLANGQLLVSGLVGLVVAVVLAIWIHLRRHRTKLGASTRA